jgi:hypothetical protein
LSQTRDTSKGSSKNDNDYNNCNNNLDKLQELNYIQEMGSDNEATCSGAPSSSSYYPVPLPAPSSSSSSSRSVKYSPEFYLSKKEKRDDDNDRKIGKEDEEIIDHDDDIDDSDEENLPPPPDYYNPLQYSDDANNIKSNGDIYLNNSCNINLMSLSIEIEEVRSKYVADAKGSLESLATAAISKELPITEAITAPIALVSSGSKADDSGEVK